MHTKRLNRVEIKDADKGEVSAIFATFNAKDSDGDVTLPGAFEVGAVVPISAYGHTSWQGALPVGKGKIRETKTEAILDGKFFLDTTDGADTFTTVKHLAEDGLGEWSYGYDVLDSDRGDFNGEPVRYLKRQKVNEVSPVLLGAGVGTRTVSAKSGLQLHSGGIIPRPATIYAGEEVVRLGRPKGAVASHDSEVTSARPWDGPEAVKALPDDARPSELRTVFAWVSPDGDPEAKDSYRFPHHHGVGGPANLKASLAAIAELNSSRGDNLSDADRKAVYDHLAAHVRDADREPPELRARGAAPTKFQDELLDGLASVSKLIDSASRVVLGTQSNTRRLSKVKTEYLEWIGDDLKRLQHLLGNPLDIDDGPSEDEIAQTVLAAVARVNDL